jgi:dTMP kinase
MNGTFISFEGIDGAGKSTHIASLAAAFEAQGRAVTLTREPGGTALAEKLRALVLNEAMDAMTEAFLVFAARRDHVVQVISPALARGDVVLCDRFTDATFAYQGGGRDFDWNILATLEAWVQGGQGGAALLQPVLTIWFDLPPAVAAARLVSARVPDKFEAQPQAFFEQVAAAYARRCASDASRFARIDANQDAPRVWTDVLAAVRGKGLLP